MDLTFTDEQQSLRDSVRRACARYAGMDVVRKVENDPLGVPASLWTGLAELGVLGLPVPEQVGGAGAGLTEVAIVAEELGRALTPSPWLVSCIAATGLLLRAAPEAAARLVPALASGERIATVAWLEPERGFAEAGIALAADPVGDAAADPMAGGEVRLHGVKRHVPFARAADDLLVLARSGDGVVLARTEPTAAGLTLDQQLTVAGDTQYQLTFDGVIAELLAGPDVWPQWHQSMLEVLVAVAALAVGGAQAVLELTVDYAKTREQFGRPLGGFQAIAHYLADAATAVDGAQTLVWEAAWAGQAGRGLDRLAPMAKLFACQTFRDVSAMALQVHGGMGFTVDCDVQLYFRRAKSLQLNWYDPRMLESLIAAAVIDA